ncbi:DgyrCDS2068 [Dimorphilus gyrociliatus]|uniref:Tetraspanin n=1 Tax=Dimorphilus gyrociliatus TaxID=2664684 RepID=A0A7I8V965_9ANNE|nr:DgyrCDS2068 [Dimorphilus gyrociliatus]
MAVGVWAYSEKLRNHPKNANLINPLFDAAIILVIVGAFALIISSAGSVSILIILQITAALLVMILSNKIKKFSEEKIGMEAIKRYRADSDLKNMIDWIQEEFYCCGTYVHTDWSKNMYYNCTENPITIEACSVPSSCCREEFRNNIFCGHDMQRRTMVEASKEIYTNGCVNSVYNKIKKNAIIIAISALSLLLFQIFAAFAALYLNLQVKAVIRFCSH